MARHCSHPSALSMCANHGSSRFAVLFYNVSLDVHRKAETPARFYFFSNGTSDMITGSVGVSSSGEKCRTHQAFMRVRKASYHEILMSILSTRKQLTVLCVFMNC